MSTSNVHTTYTTASVTDRPAPDRSRRSAPRAAGPVLVATDGGPETAAMVAAARLLAEREAAAVRVLTALEPTPMVHGVSLGMELPPAPLEAERKRSLLEAVETRLHAAGEDARRWPVEIGYGPPARVIAAAAREHRARLIVMGVGSHGVTDRVLGRETTLQTLRAADCPILAVPERFTGRPRRVVAAVDFSLASVWAVETALHLLADGATLTLAHVRTPLDRTLAEWARWNADYEERVTDQVARLRRHLDDYLAGWEGAPRDVELEVELLAGVSPAKEITALAERVGADLVVVGRSGHGLVERLFVGRVASGVIRRTTCAVLAAPTPPVAEGDRIARHLTGGVERTDPAEWPEMLEALTRRNAGRRTTLEVDDPELGAYAQERGYALLGAVYDHRDRRVELMLGDPSDRRRHLTRTITGVTSIAVACDAHDRDTALRLRHGDGQTLLVFTSGADAPTREKESTSDDGIMGHA
jgi:nucleotide-binding universal stress UspA family protein